MTIFSKYKKTLAIFFSILTVGMMLVPASALATSHAGFGNPIGGKEGKSLQVSEIVGRVVQGLLTIAGLVAVVSIIRGGILIAFAQGNAERRTKGTQAIMWSIIGLVVVFMGFIVVNFIIFGADGTSGLLKQATPAATEAPADTGGE